MNPKILRLHRLYLNHRKKHGFLTVKVLTVEKKIEALMEEGRDIMRQILTLGSDSYLERLDELETEYNTIETELYASLMVGLELLGEL